MANSEPDGAYEELLQLLNRAGIMRSPANIHGRLCGYLAAGMDLTDVAWLTLLTRELGMVGEVEGEIAALLLQAGEAANRQLALGDFSFRLLLPDDDAPLAERSWEIGQWCAGYIDALRAHAEQQIATATEGVAEVLEDLEQIAGISDEAEESEESEGDLLELAEYVRVAVIDLYEEFNGD